MQDSWFGHYNKQKKVENLRFLVLKFIILLLFLNLFSKVVAALILTATGI